MNSPRARLIRGGAEVKLRGGEIKAAQEDSSS
jgi:hypothetical protein